MLSRRLKTKIAGLIKGFVYRFNIISKEVRIGQDVKIKGSYISGDIVIGDNCRLNQASINGKVSIGNNTSIWGPNITIVAELSDIKIGNYVSIARGVTIQEYNHDISRFSTYYINKNILGNGQEDIVSNGSIEIGSDVWIGSNATILTGVKIGTGAVIGANSVVTKDVPPYAIAVGMPAKVIKFRFSEDVVRQLLASKWWELNKEELKISIKKFDEITKGI